MMTPCPVCGKPVDTLRARAVSVRDGKVVAYCSQECKATTETQPVRTPVPDPAAPLVGKVPTEEYSAPVIEILHEPASGVVTSAPDRRDADAPPTQTASSSAAGSTTIPDAKAPKDAKDPKAAKDPKPAKSAKPAKPAEDARPAKDAKPAPAATSTPTATKKAPPRTFDVEAGSESPVAGFRLDEFKSYQPDDASPKTSAGRKAAIAIIVLLVAGGGIALVYRMLSTSNAATHVAHTPDAMVKVEAPAPDAAVAQIVPAEVLERAKALLHAQMSSPIPRIARTAATILSRAKDPAALDAIAALIPAEDNETGKIDDAYALGRAGDKRGVEFLAGKLGGADREHKLGAATKLAMLGDKRGTDALNNYLEYAQFQMTTALLLAANKDPRGIKVLDAILVDPKATADDKASATIGLFVGGRTTLAPNVRAFLDDTRFNVKAALALASLREVAARDTLVKLLAVFSLRVAAARGLRLLEPTIDAAPLLPVLVAALASTKDTEQQTAAEAILILVGPAELAAYE
ncbi:MAG: hypothetical protein NT062_24585 [Proteobacteria bacterium]|nr:hypothetical protein [Pseudomonadota bacterium]